MAAVISPSSTSTSKIGSWEPNTLYMFVMVIAEIIIAGFLSRHLLKG